MTPAELAKLADMTRAQLLALVSELLERAAWETGSGVIDLEGTW